MATLKEKIKNDLNKKLNSEKDRRKKAMIQDKGKYETLSSKGVSDSSE